MYIINNAFKSIIRNKARNILIGLIVFVIATTSCVALSIRQAAETAKEDTLSSLSISAQISYDRSSAMSDMKEAGMGGKGNFDPEKLQGSTLSLEDYINYTEAQADGDSYYYSITTSLNASGDLLAYTTSSSSEEFSFNMPQKGDKFRGDFSVVGYSSYDAMLSQFGEDGSYSIKEGEMFDETSSDLNCIISDELAMFNELSVGDTITLANPNDTSELYTLNIVGIYTNSDSSSGNEAFSFSDPANNIYMNYNSLNEIISASKELANSNLDTSEKSTALIEQLNFTYTFKSADNYYNFSKEVYDLGLSDEYVVSSKDIASYENSLTPLNTLSKMAGWFFLIVLLIGGVILVAFNIFNLRERKYEVGVLTAIGMKKYKVALQFICELFAITLIAITLGTSVGATTSVPITNSLLENQIESTQESSNKINENFGFPKDKGHDMGINNFRPMEMRVSYVDSISSATNLTVILQLAGVCILLTIISSLAALIAIMRYEPLKILSSRS